MISIDAQKHGLKLLHDLKEFKRMFLILSSIVIGGNFIYRIKKLQENFQLTSQGKWGD